MTQTKLLALKSDLDNLLIEYGIDTKYFTLCEDYEGVPALIYDGHLLGAFFDSDLNYLRLQGFPVLGTQSGWNQFNNEFDKILSKYNLYHEQQNYCVSILCRK